MWDRFKKHSLSVAVGIIFLGQMGVYLWAVQPFLPKDQTSRFLLAEILLSILADTYGFLLIIEASKRLREVGSTEGAKG